MVFARLPAAHLLLLIIGESETEHVLEETQEQGLLLLRLLAVEVPARFSAQETPSLARARRVDALPVTLDLCEAASRSARCVRSAPVSCIATCVRLAAVPVAVSFVRSAHESRSCHTDTRGAAKSDPHHAGGLGGSNKARTAKRLNPWALTSAPAPAPGRVERRRPEPLRLKTPRRIR